MIILNSVNGLTLHIMKIPHDKPRVIFVGEEIYYILPRVSGFLGFPRMPIQIGFYSFFC
jgi:hypothetical protein